MQEQRRFPRFLIEDGSCNVLSEATVDIINISAQGAALVATVRLEIDREYTLKIEDHGKVLALRGTVVWSSLSGGGKGRNGEAVPIYEAGLRFSDTGSEKTSELLDFIQRKKIESDSRVIARFDVAGPEKAILHYPHSYKVKKISYGGMLITTERPFQVDDSFPLELFLGGDRTIRAYGRIASCLKITDSELDAYDVGIEFLEIPDENALLLKEFLTTLSRSPG